MEISELYTKEELIHVFIDKAASAIQKLRRIQYKTVYWFQIQY